MKILNKTINWSLLSAMFITFFLISMNFFQGRGLLEQYYKSSFFIAIVGAIILTAITHAVFMKIEPRIYWVGVVVSKLCRWPILMWKAGHKKKIVIFIGLVPIYTSIFMLINKYVVCNVEAKYWLIIGFFWYFLWGMLIDIAIRDIYKSSGFINYPKISDFKEDENG